MRIPIAREGYPFITASLLAALVVPRVPGLYFTRWFLWPLALFMVNFFRDPERRVPDLPGAVVSPADGTVIKVEATEETSFVGGPCTMVSIFMSPLDVHVNRAPVTGQVAHIAYKPGLYKMAFDPGATAQNEQNAVGFDADGLRMLVRQVAGFLARRIVCRVGLGDRISIGQRFGMIRFGSRVDVYLPPAVHVQVQPGHYVWGGSSVLGVIQ
jgi:phosphatidylserine decarboxylase